MKKIFMIFSSGAMLSTAILLGSCNNAADVKKQQDAENANIQAQVDAAMSGVQAQADKDCSAMVDSIANVQFTAWKEEEAKAKKGGHKPAPKPKPVVKKDEPKKPSNTNRPGTNENTPATNTNRPGTNQSKTPATNTSRPGATKQ